MARIAYFWKEINKYAASVHSECGKSVHSIRIDMLKDFLQYGASPANYYKFSFCNIDASLKRTFVTNRVSSCLIKKYNDSNYIMIFEDKTTFAEKFSKYFGRSWVSTDALTQKAWDDFVDAVCVQEGESNRVICKPVGEAQGRGIRVINPRQYTFGRMQEEFPRCIVEEFIHQHHELSAFYDKAVNCLRLITVLKDGQAHVLVGNLTFGSEFEIANASYGGITVEVDVQTGKLISDGGQFHHPVFPVHPYSGKTFKGFMIPYWNEIIAMVKEAALLVPQIGYVGWDIAITETGPVLIEGNTTPGYTYFQIPNITENHGGVMEIYRPYL